MTAFANGLFVPVNVLCLGLRKGLLVLPYFCKSGLLVISCSSTDATAVIEGFSLTVGANGEVDALISKGFSVGLVVSLLDSVPNFIPVG